MKFRIYIFALLISLLMTVPAAATRPKAYSKEKPLTVDWDMKSVDEPKSVPTGYLYDWIDGTLFQPVRKGFNIPARLRGHKRESVNVNTMDEVPDSSWYTNRDVTRMTLEEIAAGPNTGGGPAAGRLTVIRGKSIGVTPGFWVKDSTGQVFIMKFDHPDYPELASGADIIASKMFYALGYNVPQNYIHRFRVEDLVIGEGAKFTDEKGKKTLMTRRHLNDILSAVARSSDGSFRALASKLIKGTPKGGFTFSGLRKDDRNDIIPHQMRRDLRGLRIFSAWIEHNDVRVGNTLDMYVEEDGRKFMRHYLIDFGSALGSDTTQPNVPEVGHEHRLDLAQAQKVLLTAGIRQPKWRSEKHDPVFSPAVGRYSTKSFRPKKWKSNFPLSAFSQMTDQDGFWAARVISRFTPNQIRAMVETAEYSDPKDTDYLTEQIIARQQKIVRDYSERRVGVTNFRLSRGEEISELRFDDLRMLFPLDEKVNRFFEYEIVAPGKQKVVFANGVTPDPVVRISRELVGVIAGLGSTESDEGIARLVIRRAGEKGSAVVYLWADKRLELRVAGIIY